MPTAPSVSTCCQRQTVNSKYMKDLIGILACPGELGDLLVVMPAEPDIAVVTGLAV